MERPSDWQRPLVYGCGTLGAFSMGGQDTDPAVINRALAWLERTQLPNGYWPYHYLDDGTSLALIGAVDAMKALAAAEKKCAQ